MYRHRENVFLQKSGQLFLWEPAWTSFRPIERYAWDGSKYTVLDKRYTLDITDPYYGFGSKEMKQYCEQLNAKYSPEQARNVQVIPPHGDVEWMRDRFVSFTACAPRDVTSWKRLCNGRARTCRHAPRGKQFTRRTL